jgi:hypothetical protein
MCHCNSYDIENCVWFNCNGIYPISRIVMSYLKTAKVVMAYFQLTLLSTDLFAVNDGKSNLRQPHSFSLTFGHSFIIVPCSHWKWESFFPSNEINKTSKRETRKAADGANGPQLQTACLVLNWALMPCLVARCFSYFLFSSTLFNQLSITWIHNHTFSIIYSQSHIHNLIFIITDLEICLIQQIHKKITRVYQ